MASVVVNVGDVDWELLRTQKQWLADVAMARGVELQKQSSREVADGLLHLLDRIMDEACVQLGSEIVFGTKT